MNAGHAALAVLLTTITCFAQGQVYFANRVGAGGAILNAPVVIPGNQDGPGPDWTAQLLLVNANNSLTPLMPASTFNKAGTGSAAIASGYWAPQTVTIPGHYAGETLNFVVRAWPTAYGSYEGAIAGVAGWGQSAVFSAVLGGASQDPNIPPAIPANLLNLKSFFVAIIPEPSTITIGLLGAAALVMFRRRQ
jgi:hypothetical protein